MPGTAFTAYFDTLHQVARAIEATDGKGQPTSYEDAGEALKNAVLKTHQNGKRIIFVGNGGSAGITSHMAIDYLKNGKLRTLVFNDGASLTCLANDLGYESVFSYPIEMHAVEGDLLIAISSSGKSPNILKAVDAARAKGCLVATLSGFKPDNPLRRKGDINIYVPSDSYGYVELLHLTFLHAVLDLAMFKTAPDAFQTKAT